MSIRSHATARRNDHDRLLGLAVLIIILGGAVLRLHGLDRTSIWNDEAASWAMARLPFWDMIRATLADDHPALYNIIIYITTRLLGDSETALRLPSAVLGIASIYLIYQLGAVLWDRTTGVFAAALLAFASFHIWHSQEARMYPLLCLTATAFALATVLFLSSPTRLRACLCGLAGTALLYSHPFGIFNWAAIDLGVGLALFSGRLWTDNLRPWLTIQVLMIVAYLPWAFALSSRLGEVLNEDIWIPFPTIPHLYWMARAFAGGPAMLCALLLLVLIALSSWNDADIPTADGGTKPLQPLPRPLRIWRGPEWQKQFLLAWGVLPLLVGYALSVVVQPILQDRYLIGSLSPLLLLAARGLWMLRSKPFVLAFAVTALVACSAPAVYRSVAVDTTEDGRAAVAAFSGQFRKDTDGVVFSTPGVSNVFAYYFRKPVTFKSVIFHPESDPVEWSGVTRVWVFARKGIEFQTAPVLARIASLYQLRQVSQFNNFALYLFASPQPAGGTGAQVSSPRAEARGPSQSGWQELAPRQEE